MKQLVNFSIPLKLLYGASKIVLEASHILLLNLFEIMVLMKQLPNFSELSSCWNYYAHKIFSKTNHIFIEFIWKWVLQPL